jgi:nitrile hydratase
MISHDHNHDDHHGHDHGHGHDDHSHLSAMEARVRALETILVAKGLVDPAALDAIIDTYETKIGPRNGARVVAKAWADPAYASRLKADATAAIAELGFTGRQGEHMVAVFNDAGTHHRAVLGLPPVWYKSAPYRSRAVLDPRGVLAEFGLVLDPAVQVRVWDSTAEMRYLVIPERPAGTDGWSEDALAGLVTRDAMIGTGVALMPGSRIAGAVLP